MVSVVEVLAWLTLVRVKLFDRHALASRRIAYERLDQLTLEVLMRVR